ncbi:MAG: hypothetical protein LBV08_04980, partial [Clostridiales bacterium]|nr:hypothetical protein [Clostridiales bacterium]
EELEPGYGWNYEFLKIFNESPPDGETIGREIVDRYMDFYEGTDEALTLSVTDLSKLGGLVGSLDSLGYVAEGNIAEGGFNAISKARKGTKSFGLVSEGVGYDLVDIKHLALNLEGEFPDEASAVLSAIDTCIIYNQSSMENCYGLSTYIPYISKDTAKGSVAVYRRLGIMPSFTDFLVSFTEKLTGSRIKRDNISRAMPELTGFGDISVTLAQDALEEINNINLVIWKQLEDGSDYFIRLGMDSNVDIEEGGRISTMFEGYWATIGGQPVCLYEIERSGPSVKYSAPAILNGEWVNLIILFDNDNPDGKLLGALPGTEGTGSAAPKYMYEIQEGDIISLQYLAQLFLEDLSEAAGYPEYEKWHSGEEFTAPANLEVSVGPVDSELYMYGFQIEDIQNNTYYTDFIEIRY